MNKLEERFREELNKANFSFFESMGFQKNPELALLAGMAIGYKLALSDHQKNIDDALKRIEQKLITLKPEENNPGPLDPSAP